MPGAEHTITAVPYGHLDRKTRDRTTATKSYFAQDGRARGDILQQKLGSVRGASRIRGCRRCTSVSAPASSSAPSGMAAVSGPGRGHVRIGRRHGGRRCSVRQQGLLLRWARRTLLGLALEDSRRGQDAGLRSRSGAGAAPRTPVVVFLPPAAGAALPPLSRGPSILRGLSLPLPFLLLFFLSGALAPAAALGDASPAERRLKLPRRETKHGPRPSPRTVRARRRKRRSRRGRRSGCTGTGVRRGT